MSHIQNLWVISWTVSFTEKDAWAEDIENTLEGWAEAISVFENMESPPSGLYDDDDLPIASLHTIEAYGREEPYHNTTIQALLKTYPADAISKVKENADWFKPLPPKQIGRFWLDASGQQKENLWAICIQSATAFGSGEHPTTLGCIQLMDKLEQAGYSAQHVVDVGCGSGILSLAAGHLWPKSCITAIDIDPESVRVTKQHAKQHNMNIDTFTGDGLKNFSKQSQDLIIANILLTPLLNIEPDVSKIGSKYFITAGILEEQFETLKQAYQKNWEHQESIQQDGWDVSLWMKKS